MNRLRLSLLLVVVLLGAACSSIKTGADVDPSVDFSKYRTAAWLDAGVLVSPNSEMISPLMDRRIRDAVDVQLMQRGIVVVPDSDDADLVIAVVIGAREKVDYSGYPVHFRPHIGACGPECATWQSQAHIYTQGTLSLDLYDTQSGDPVWHAWIRKSITQADRDDPRRATEDAIASMFKRFPATGQVY